jgi:hypothetical protein
MKLMRARVMLAAGLVAAAGTITGTALAASPASAAASPVVVIACHRAQVRPAVYNIGCAPSQEFMSGLSWASWKSVAFGGGVLKVNSCTPTCAQGKYISYPIHTVLWRAAPWPHHAGRDYFTRLTWIFTGKILEVDGGMDRPNLDLGLPDL